MLHGWSFRLSTLMGHRMKANSHQNSNVEHERSGMDIFTLMAKRYAQNNHNQGNEERSTINLLIC